MLDREEYVEQAYFFRTLGERAEQKLATQDLLKSVREEILATTKLPLAIDFLASELNLTGVFGPAMARLPHYFTPFQTFVVQAAENERGKFDFAVALSILEREALYRAEGSTRQGMFLYQFECLCRNRLGYDRGLDAIAADPMYDELWREWIRTVRQQIGLIDFADLVYVRSEHYLETQARLGRSSPNDKPALFGVKEGRIALANRLKDPLLLFAALERHLHYPTVPRPKKVDESRQILPTLLRRVERLETRLKLLEEEQKGGIDLTKFYGRTAHLPDDDEPPVSDAP
ncbi:MAG TPA: hypothetical protein VHD36_00765 [Pirellulales bacterium]|nr:hypothetical protein [Pirellulales bacterium]